MLPLAYDRGLAACEEMLLEYAKDSRTLHAKSDNTWPYRKGTVAYRTPVFLYLCAIVR